jgi:hypothetical protein
MEKNVNLTIIKKIIKNKHKLIPFNNKSKTYKFIYPKYNPAYFNEWKNSVYYYNKNKVKNLPVNILNINQIIDSYFHLYFANKSFIKRKRYIQKRKIRYFLKKIYISKIGIKHTNSKAIITLFLLNIGKNSYKNKYKLIKELFEKKNSKNSIVKSFSKSWKDRIFKLEKLIKDKFKYLNQKNILSSLTIKNLFKSKYFFIKSIILLLTINKITKILKRKFRLFRKYEYLYMLNQFKLKKKLFLSKLSSKLSKIINKKIEFNLISLKSIAYNPDIFTKILALKLAKKIKRRKSRTNVYKNMKILLYKGKIPNIDRILELRKFDKTLTKNWLQNKYKTIALFNILKSKKTNNLEKLLSRIYSNNLLEKSNLNSWTLIRNNLIFNSIKYKNLGGMRLEVKGRLTKRYRADRSIHKLYLKGGFNNLDSSIKKLPSVVLRGYINNNSTYSMSKSKRRVGAFAVKGWISGK